jgi:ribonuclease BN (tRNA processing enzyme)
MKFEVTVLGSGSALPTLNRRPSAHFVNCNERFVLIDCGEGTQLQLRKYKLKFQRIQVILISHLHGDHYFGLVGLNSGIVATVCGVLFLAQTFSLMRDCSRKSALKIMFGSFLYLPIVQIAYLLDKMP